MAMHENNKKKLKKKKEKLHHREVDCMFRSLTAGQNNYTYINTRTHPCMQSPTHSEQGYSKR